MVIFESPVCDFSFHGKDAREVYQFSFRQHWIRLLWPFVRMLAHSAVVIGGGYFIFFQIGVPDASSRHGLLLGLCFLLALIQWAFLIRFYTYFLYVIIVTDRRIHRIKKTLITVDDHQTIDIWTLQDINKSQRGPIQNLLGFGTILFESQDTVLKLHFIPRVRDVYHRISHIRELARDAYSHGSSAVKH